MAPYDRAAFAGDDGLPPPLHVTNHGTGIHSISQHDGSQEFEVKLLTLKSSNDKQKQIRKQKQIPTHQRQQQQQQQHDQERHNQQPHDQQPQLNNTVNNNNNNNNNTKFSAKRWAFRKIEKGDGSNRKSSKNSKKQKKEPANHPTAAATLFPILPTKEKTPKKSKEGIGGGTARVSFNRETRIRQIPHRSEISPELKALLWVNYHDWQATQGERQRISRAVLFDRLTIDTQTDDLYLRGLETLIPELATLRRETIHAAKALVLQEQARARLEREPLDGVRLARWYGSATRGSRQAAWEQAIEDYCQVLDDLRQGRSLADIV